MSNQSCNVPVQKPKWHEINQIFKMSHLELVLPQPKLPTGTYSLQNTTQGMMWQQKEIECLI